MIYAVKFWLWVAAYIAAYVVGCALFAKVVF